ncbi:hypothetical protein FisN_4Hh366 [Fistulifera solaris]|uniref:TFA2 Winged helix domain-containing protein n=1 Tax=Fistulifera solaris TaxID=1519565 RepID=A0A1Z5KQ56_FISSO|nr:hypothetical protein FisN_4Hh366 [Fistulifera solaris]|eukprot:GAX28443.1 hypothetical protein FisN_4Hh366 [Fistulifera solaris]
MSNQYGFDFLRTEHVLESDSFKVEETSENGGMDVSQPRSSIDVEKKPDLEKQFDILAFLRDHRGSGCLGTNVIYKSTGIDLDLDSNQKVVEMLHRNPKVRVEMVPDPENPTLRVATYAYQAKYTSVRNRATLLAQINRMTSGISFRDLLDSYATVNEDLNALITAGDIIAVKGEDRDKTLFARGEPFIVELDGLIHLTLPEPKVSPTPKTSPENGMPDKQQSTPTEHTSDPATVKVESEDQPPNGGADEIIPQIYIADIDMDPRTQIRRGEAIQIGGQWFRVSSAVKEGPLSEQPVRAQAPLSVVSLKELDKKNELDGYIRPFTDVKVPVDAALHPQTIENIQEARKARETLIKMVHGRSGGAAGQLFGSRAHASNPVTLAKSIATSTTTSVQKRPNMSAAAGHSHANQQHQQRIPKEDIAKVATTPALSLYNHARRHGCTLDVRDMYLATRKEVPKSDHELEQKLREHKLLDPGETMRRPRLSRTGTNQDNDGKPKKRRYYEKKNQRITNTHLDGTIEGSELARAIEKQKQGQAVGDGGM